MKRPVAILSFVSWIMVLSAVYLAGVLRWVSWGFDFWLAVGLLALYGAATALIAGRYGT